MSSLALIVLVIGAGYFYLAQRAVLLLRSTGQHRLHSLPHYYGYWAAAVAVLPALLLLLILSIADDIVFKIMVRDFYPPDQQNLDSISEAIVLAKIMNVVKGIQFGSPDAWVIAAGETWIQWTETSRQLISVIVLGVSLLGGLFAYRKVSPEFRSRNAVERIILWILGLSSTVAILTTIGIVLSVLFESIRFFKMVPPTEFIFGLTWNPQFEGAERAGSGQMGLATYGMVPLFVGTLLISVVALTVAVPVGLFAAIYLAEYANNTVRGGGETAA